MTGKFQIISMRPHSFNSKRGRVEQTLLALLDLDKNALLNTVDYVISEEDLNKYGNKLVGKIIELGVQEIKPDFGGRLRISGPLLSIS